MAAGPSKGGYDYEFVAPPPKSLECSVCLLILRDPHVISCCGNEFCQACIERVQRDGKPCPLCNKPGFTTFLHKKLVREVNALVVRCPQKELGCNWEGELGQVKKHLNPGEGTSEGCGYIPVICSYGCGVELPRCKLPKHEFEVCPKRPIERQIGSLMLKLETVIIDNQLLRQELDKVKDTHQNELKKMNTTVSDLQQQNKKLKSDLEANAVHLLTPPAVVTDLRQELDKVKGTHQNEMQKMKTMISDLQQQNEKLKNDLEQKCASLESITVHLTTPPVYFRIDNFEHLKSTDQIWSSDPFYSHPGGYKMMLKVHPNGFKSSRGYQMSVFIHLRRGEFDDQLQWPFNGEITIETFNLQTKKWLKPQLIELSVQEMSSVSDGLVDIISKPTKFCNHGYGYPAYISHTEVQSYYYNRDGDNVSMRVAAVRLFHV